ncbi:MAG: divalent-cation tolerance protein CutA [Chloroflexi bacterium]|nr:divalent-cation tolerance protein CutA [Chloroflexota bacterium]
MIEEFCLVTTAVDDRDMADRMANFLVESRLAACVHVTPIHSTYRWKGKVEAAREFLLIIKTLTRVYPRLEKAIQEQHPYEIPEIIQLSLNGGFRPYLKWIEDNVE